jgi:hypothetical protein
MNQEQNEIFFSENKVLDCLLLKPFSLSKSRKGFFTIALRAIIRAPFYTWSGYIASFTLGLVTQANLARINQGMRFYIRNSCLKACKWINL